MKTSVDQQSDMTINISDEIALCIISRCFSLCSINSVSAVGGISNCCLTKLLITLQMYSIVFICAEYGLSRYNSTCHSRFNLWVTWRVVTDNNDVAEILSYRPTLHFGIQFFQQHDTCSFQECSYRYYVHIFDTSKCIKKQRDQVRENPDDFKFQKLPSTSYWKFVNMSTLLSDIFLKE